MQNAIPSAIEAPGSLENELVNLMAHQANQTVAVAGPLFPVMLVPLLAQHVGWLYPSIWGATMILACVGYARVVARLASRSSMAPSRKLAVVRLTFAFTAISISALQVFFPFVSLSLCIVITIFAAGCVTSFIMPTAGHLPTFVPTMIIFMLPCALNYAFSDAVPMGKGERLVLVGICGIYCAAMAAYAKGVYSVFVSSFRIRLQRDEMNARLSSALTDAEAANRAKTRFLASASHDLRQPMHALALFSGSLQLRPLESRTRTIAEQIDRAVRVLTFQLDALLDISRLDAGIVKPGEEALDLTAWLHQVIDEYAPQADQKGIQLARKIAGGLRVATDPTLLRRVVANLLSNAVKYTATGAVQIEAAASDGSIRIAISDTGPGIPAVEQERVFEEFYQLHNPERDRTQGLGLGLAIVRRVSELLALNLSMRSTEGMGTEFSLFLPVLHTEPQSPGLSRLAPLEFDHRIRILVIDDEEIVRDGMRTLLEEMDYDVHVAASTEAALGVAAAFHPQVVLADLRLRGDDTGIRAIRSLQAVDPRLKGLLISGDIAPVRLREAHDAGIRLLHKPVPAEVLREAVHQLMSDTDPDVGDPAS